MANSQSMIVSIKQNNYTEPETEPKQPPTNTIILGCGHSKIVRVRVYYLYCTWLPVLTTKYRMTHYIGHCYNSKKYFIPMF